MRLPLAGDEKLLDSTSPFCVGPAGRLKFRAEMKLIAVLPNFCCWTSVVVLVRPLKKESSMARAESAVESAEMPKMSGRSLPENADLRRLRLDVVGLGRGGQGGGPDGKRDDQGAANHEAPAKSDE